MSVRYEKAKKVCLSLERHFRNSLWATGSNKELKSEACTLWPLRRPQCCAGDATHAHSIIGPHSRLTASTRPTTILTQNIVFTSSLYQLYNNIVTALQGMAKDTISYSIYIELNLHVVWCVAAFRQVSKQNMLVVISVFTHRGIFNSSCSLQSAYHSKFHL